MKSQDDLEWNFEGPKNLSCDHPKRNKYTAAEEGTFDLGLKRGSTYINERSKHLLVYFDKSFRQLKRRQKVYIHN